MIRPGIKFFGLFFIFNMSALLVFSQNAFVGTTRPSYKAAGQLARMEDSVKKQFERQKLTWPPQSLYIRSFKYDRQLEVWVKGDSKENYKLFKTYKVCMQSGTMSSKRMEGDYQVPEGLY